MKKNLNKNEQFYNHFFYFIFFLFQPPFDKNGVDSPVDGQKYNSENASTSLGTSIDSAMVTASTTFAKNRFLSGDHVNANHARDALLRRQLFAIGKWLLRLALFLFFFFISTLREKHNIVFCTAAAILRSLSNMAFVMSI